MVHIGSLFASHHWVLRMVRNIVEVLEVPALHLGELKIANLVEMFYRPAFYQLVVHPKWRIWNSTTGTTMV